jgi:glucoside 3-dehydrogenase (cytochrome c) hitch-hiker subunit
VSRPGIGRREAVRRLALGGLGSAALPAWAEPLVALADARPHGHQATPAPGTAWKPKLLDAHQDATVSAISELIIPATETPGAQAALVNQFIDGVLAAAAEPEQREFLRGLRFVDGRSRQLFGADFVSARPDEQTALLTTLSSEKNTALEDENGRDFWKVIKALTVAGYYGSQVGLEQELGDDGRMFVLEFEGCRHPEHQ